MYENNVYIKNYNEVKQYDNDHHLRHDAMARAQYKHWRSIQTGVPNLMSVEDKRLLGI